jgi:hypothetical protein
VELIIKQIETKTYRTMKILRRVLFAIAILSTTGLATSCFDNSEEVFEVDGTGNNSSTESETNPDQWN